jgi:hypothetical protein
VKRKRASYAAGQAAAVARREISMPRALRPLAQRPCSIAVPTLDRPGRSAGICQLHLHWRSGMLVLFWVLSMARTHSLQLQWLIYNLCGFIPMRVEGAFAGTGMVMENCTHGAGEDCALLFALVCC